MKSQPKVPSIFVSLFVILFLVMNGYQIIYGFFLIYWKCVFGLSEIRYGNMSLTKKNYCDKNIDDNKNK
jgi:hypothetical protein